MDLQIHQILRARLTGYARSYLKKALGKGIKTGSLLLIEDGEKFLYGNTSGPPAAQISVLNEEFWLKIFLRHDLGFSEAYMDGDFETSDLKAVLTLFHLNRQRLTNLQSIISFLLSVFSALYIWLFGQTLVNSRNSCITGYDWCNEFFQSFLSEEMTYSCAIWPENLRGVKGDLMDGPFDGDLEAAQLIKIHSILRKARVKTGHRLLEFGSGWGAMAIEAAKLGATVDTITLSIEQKKGAEQRIKAAGLEDKIRVHLCDYRQLPANFEKSFDAFVSLEMVEAVGYRHLDQFFKIVDWALKPHEATAVITISTQPEWRYTILQANDYAREYQWPGFFCPSATSFISASEKSLNGRFVVEAIHDYTSHYPRTLREWGRRLQKNWNEEVTSALIKEQPQFAEGDNLQIFKRRFEYMYVYTEVAYANAYMYLKTFTFARPMDRTAESG